MAEAETVFYISMQRSKMIESPLVITSLYTKAKEKRAVKDLPTSFKYFDSKGYTLHLFRVNGPEI
jgi:hypothetical protein